MIKILTDEDRTYLNLKFGPVPCPRDYRARYLFTKSLPMGFLVKHSYSYQTDSDGIPLLSGKSADVDSDEFLWQIAEYHGEV